MHILKDMVKIAGEVVTKERFGLASSNPENRTFTGDVLFTNQKQNDFSKSIEEKFEDTAQVDALTVWKSNGAIPFADMLLDFVQIGAITFEQAEFSVLQRQKDESASLDSLYRAEDGNIYLGEGALDYRNERLAKLGA